MRRSDRLLDDLRACRQHRVDVLRGSPTQTPVSSRLEHANIESFFQLLYEPTQLIQECEQMGLISRSDFAHCADQIRLLAYRAMSVSAPPEELLHEVFARALGDRSANTIRDNIIRTGCQDLIESIWLQECLSKFFEALIERMAKSAPPKLALYVQTAKK